MRTRGLAQALLFLLSKFNILWGLSFPTVLSIPKKVTDFSPAKYRSDGSQGTLMEWSKNTPNSIVIYRSIMQGGRT